MAEHQHRHQQAEQAEDAVDGSKSGNAAMRDQRRHGKQQCGHRKEILRPLARMKPVDAAPFANPRRGEGDHAADPRRQQQAQIAGVGQQESQRRPRNQRAVGRRDVEYLAEHGEIEHEAGESHHRRQLGEISGRIAGLDQDRQSDAGQRRAEQDRDLGGLVEAPPELVEKKEHAGRQRQRAEEGCHPHAERQLFGLCVAIDVEAAGKT